MDFRNPGRHSLQGSAVVCLRLGIERVRQSRVHEFRGSGVQGFRGSGVQGFRV